MKKFNSLKKNKEFQNVYKNGKSCANKYLVMYVYNSESEYEIKPSRIGISVSKKVGNSVVRHRMTRLVRESYRLNEELFSSNLNIVVVVRPVSKGKNFKEIESALLHLAKLHGILKEMV